VALCTRDNDPPAHLPTAAGSLASSHMRAPPERALPRPERSNSRPTTTRRASAFAARAAGRGPASASTRHGWHALTAMSSSDSRAPPVAGLLTFAGRFTPKLAGELEHAQPVNSHATRRALVAPLLAALAATLIPTGARIPPSDSRGQGGGPAADPFFGFSRPGGGLGPKRSDVYRRAGSEAGAVRAARRANNRKGWTSDGYLIVRWYTYPRIARGLL
jgi:hypothetical protein